MPAVKPNWGLRPRRLQGAGKQWPPHAADGNPGIALSKDEQWKIGAISILLEVRNRTGLNVFANAMPCDADSHLSSACFLSDHPITT
jgi:hypothetical protein